MEIVRAANFRRFSTEKDPLPEQTSYKGKTLFFVLHYADDSRIGGADRRWRRRIGLIGRCMFKYTFKHERMDFTAANKLTCGLVGLTMYT